jgi:hypothetical protein
MTDSFITLQRGKTTPTHGKWQALVCYCYDPKGHGLEFWTEEAGNLGGGDE